MIVLNISYLRDIKSTCFSTYNDLQHQENVNRIAAEKLDKINNSKQDGTLKNNLNIGYKYYACVYHVSGPKPFISFHWEKDHFELLVC